MRLDNGGGLDHARQYAAQTGENLDDVLEAYGIELPDIPDGLEWIWEWFWELSAGRQYGFGPLPLSWADMAAWAAISGVALQPWLAGMFRRMDMAYLAEMGEKAKAEEKQRGGKQQRTYHPTARRGRPAGRR